MKKCANCETELFGVYCHNCAEKSVKDEDFQVRRLINNFLVSLTSLDSKFLRTSHSLIRHPGHLSSEYFRGVRKPYLGPFQCFLVVSILFFIFITDFDVFYVPAVWFFTDYTQQGNHVFGVNTSALISDLITQKMQKYEMTRKEITILYDLKVSGNSKLFLFLAIPFMALASYAMHGRKHREFGKHIIFATYNFSFVILCILAILILALKTRIIPESAPKLLFISLIFSSVIFYFVLSTYKAWQVSWFFSLISSVFQFIILVLFLAVFRSGISYMSLALL